MKHLLLLLAAAAGAWSCGNPGNAGNSQNANNSQNTDTDKDSNGAVGDAPGLLLVANKSDNTLYFINAETLELVDSTTTGEDPHEAIVTQDGSMAYTANMGGNTLSVIDMGKLEEVRRIDLSEYGKPHGLAVTGDGKYLYVTTEGSRVAVLEIETATDKVSRVFETGEKGTHMVVLGKDETTAYAANLGSGTTTVIDLKAGKVVRTLDTGEGTEGIDVRPDGKEIWVTARSGSVVIIDAETNEITDRLPAEGLPIRVKFTPDGEQALVSCMKGGEVIVFDVSTRKPVKRIAAGEGPVGLLIRPDGECAFVANTQANTVSVVNLEQAAVTGSIPAGNTPDGMAFGPISTSK